jgi:hypothetical protein
VLFKVPAYIFSRGSPAAQQLLDRRAHSSDKVITLDGVRPVDFERFLDVVLCKYAVCFQFQREASADDYIDTTKRRRSRLGMNGLRSSICPLSGALPRFGHTPLNVYLL